MGLFIRKLTIARQLQQSLRLPAAILNLLVTAGLSQHLVRGEGVQLALL